MHVASLPHDLPIPREELSRLRQKLPVSRGNRRERLSSRCPRLIPMYEKNCSCEGHGRFLPRWIITHRVDPWAHEWNVNYV